MAIILSTTTLASPALYAELIEAIYNLTKRPDLVAETAIALRKATMKLHMADFWKNDLSVIAPYVLPDVVSSDSSFRYTIDTTDITIFPQFRKLQFIKEYNSPLTGTELQFDEIDAANLLDNYNLEQVNVWYQAAQQVQLRSSKVLSGVTLGYWRYPNIIPTAYSSWIARDFPDAIIEEATSNVLRVIGKTEEAAALARNFDYNVHLITMGQVT